MLRKDYNALIKGRKGIILYKNEECGDFGDTAEGKVGLSVII